MRLLASFLLTCVAAVASASSDPISACRAEHAGNDAAHIACLENALRAVGAAPQTVAAEPAAMAPAAPAAAAAAAPVAAVASAAAAATPAPTGLGAEQAKARQRTYDTPAEQVSVRIVAATYDAAGFGVFRTADGQVWRETVASPERHHLDPKREYDARIERGKVGGYRMYVDGIKWMHKVERLK
jgi:hypothetical protein